MGDAKNAKPSTSTPPRKGRNGSPLHVVWVTLAGAATVVVVAEAIGRANAGRYRRR